MANKKISELESRASLSLSDLMAVGDPSTGYLYKTTISDLKTLTGAGVVSFNGRFGTVNPAEGDYTLTQLGDVIITSATNGQVLQYNGSNWVNTTLPANNDTLDIVTGRGNTTANSITVGSVTAAGLSNLLGQIRTFATTGNTYIGANPGSATDAGYKLDVNGSVRSIGAFYGTQLFTGAHSFRDQMYITATTDGWTKQNAYNAASAFAMGFVGDLRFAPSAAVKAVFSFNGTYSNNGTIYAGDSSLVKIFTGDAFGNTVGATTYNGYGINLMPTLNYTTGTSNFTGIYYNPTLTATTGLTHYAMNLVAGLVRMGTLAGTGSRMVVADASGNLSTQAIPSLSGYVTLDTFQTITASKTFSVGFSIASAGGSNQLTSFENTNSIHSGSGGSNIFGFNNSNNIYFGKGLSNGGVIAWNNSTVRTYTLPNADGTLALTSDIPSVTGFVPYTGANANVNLGTFDMYLRTLYVEGNGSYQAGILLKQNNGYNFVTGAYTQIVPNGVYDVDVVHNQANTTRRRYSMSVAGLQDGDSFQYLVPRKNGTFAMTSDIPSVAGVYLPLSGGTLTGGLVGTTATFSGDVIRTSSNVGGINEIAVINTATSGTSNARIRISTAFNGGTTLGDALTQYTDNNNFNWCSGSGVSTSRDFVITNHFTLGTNIFFRLAASTGAATFSSNLVAINGNGLTEFKINNNTSEWEFYMPSGGTDLRLYRGSDKVTFLANGNIGIGTTNPTANLQVIKDGAGNANSNITGSQLILSRTTGATENIAFRNSGSSNGISGTAYAGQIISDGNNVFEMYTTSTAAMVFGTNGTERARITSGGYLKASPTGAYLGSTSNIHEFRGNTSNSYEMIISNFAASPASQYILDLRFSSSTPNNSNARFWNCEDSTANRAYMRSDGGLANYQSNNTNLSDIRTKKDITLIESYWDKFKAMEIVKFRYKDQTHDDFNIGVIAQQVESVAPEFIDTDGWGKEKEKYKSVYTADLYHASIAVLKEAMGKIESLELQLAQLRN
jgi:hypothetical protein